MKTSKCRRVSISMGSLGERFYNDGKVIPSIVEGHAQVHFSIWISLRRYRVKGG